MFTCYFIYRIVIVLFVITTSLTSVAVSLIYIAISLIFIAISLTLLMCVTLYRVCSCGLLCYRILIATSWLPLLFLRLLPLSLSHLIWLLSHWCWCLFLWLCLRLLWHACCFINDFAIYLNSLPFHWLLLTFYRRALLCDAVLLWYIRFLLRLHVSIY